VQDLQLTIVNDSDQGLPAGATSVSYLSAITYGSGNLYVFGTMESRPIHRFLEFGLVLAAFPRRCSRCCRTVMGPPVTETCKKLCGTLRTFVGIYPGLI